MRKQFAAIVFWLTLTACAAYAFPLALLTPPKLNTQTNGDYLVVSGMTNPQALVSINSYPIEVDDQGNFTAALILNRAKNYAQLRVSFASEEAVREIKVLKLLTFPDIEGDLGKNFVWARKEIIYLTTMQELESMPDGLYYPDGYMTRGELATWLVRALNLPLQKVSADVCIDVPKEHWRAAYIKTALGSGFFTTKGSFFYPDEPVTRGQVAEIVVKALGYEKSNPKYAGFFDVKESQAESSAINEAFVNNLIIGVSKKRLLYVPKRYMTRAEAAMLFSRLPVEKAKIKDLFSFNVGYDFNVACRISTPPKINWVKLDPGVLVVERAQRVLIEAAVTDQQGPDDIGYVKVDLSRLGGPQNAAMTDDGANGDKTANDGTYSLAFDTNFQTTGTWSLVVTAFDKSGLSRSQEVKLVVKE